MPGWKGTRARESSDETLFYPSFYTPSGTETHLNAARAQDKLGITEDQDIHLNFLRARQDCKSLVQCLREESSFDNTNKTRLGLLAVGLS